MSVAKTLQNIDPNGKLLPTGSRLVRVYKDIKRPILGSRSRLDRGQVSSGDKRVDLKTTMASTGDQLASWKGRSVRIEICDGDPTNLMTAGRDQIAFDEAECWSQSEEEDEDEWKVDETNQATAKMKQHLETSKVYPEQVPTSAMRAVSSAERIWLSEYFNLHLISTSVARSNDTNTAHIFDDILLEDSEDDFDEMPFLIGSGRNCCNCQCENAAIAVACCESH